MENAIAKRPMTDREATECVAKINANMHNVRQLVIELHDRKGWDALGHVTWEECVEKEFKQGRSYIFYQLKAAQIEQNVTESTIVDLGKIPEGQLRPLAGLTPEKQREAWKEAVETAPDGKMTAAHVTKVVKGMTEEPPKTI